MLKSNATEDDIRRLCEEAGRYGFATVCINPIYIPLTKDLLRDSNVKVCVAVGFRLEQHLTKLRSLRLGSMLRKGLIRSTL